MKKLFLLTALILAHSYAFPAFLKDYAALKGTSVFSESHYISYADEKTARGGGLFSWDGADTRQEVWGLIIASEGKPTGRWVRQDVTDLHPEWFGAMNKRISSDQSPTFSAFGYSITEIQKRYSRLIPDITLNDTPDWAALQMMCRLQEVGWNSIELNSDTFYINRTIQLPEPVKQSAVVHYQLEGNGATFISVSTKGFPLLYSMPDNQKQSENVFCARRFTIRNLILKGNTKSNGDVGIAIGGTFHTLIENIQLAGLDTGVLLLHALSSIITRCNAVGCTSVSYYIGSGNGRWMNANATNSGSNQSKVTSCRQFSGDSQYAGVIIRESSECRVEDFTLDGGGKRHTAYAIYIDTRGATTVKDGYVKGIHGEAAVDSALVKFRGSAALFEVEDVFVQYPCTLVELDAMTGASQVTCSAFSYYPGGSDFANKGNGKWLFDNVNGKSKTINWKNGNGYGPPVTSKLTDNKKL
ncbi:MAG: hypothetical protein ABI772_00630 [Bacteroidota bacterium]